MKPKSRARISTSNRYLNPRTAWILAFAAIAIGAWATRTSVATAAPPPPTANQLAFEQTVKPFFKQNCMQCHDTDNAMAGVRVDQLDTTFDDRQVKVWEGIRARVAGGSMPPKDQHQPTPEERKQVVDWIKQNIEIARLRPSPKNGLVRRLTVAQYRNTLRELLHLEDDLTTGLPPDAVSKDGFVNNQETLHLSPLLLESYFEIAEEALKRALVDPSKKPAVQDFKVELGAKVNPKPFPEELILGAGSALLKNEDVLITQPVPAKPFAFTPHPMQTDYRFIEGYQGNDTVRGWREYHSIYHVVYADMRGSGGYPKGQAYSTVPQGLLLRPAIPNDELFGADGTYGPKANFKISTRELPDDGRFRITILAAKYNDGLLIDKIEKDKKDDLEGKPTPGAITVQPAKSQTAVIPKAGVYQVDAHVVAANLNPPAPDASKLTEGLAVGWPSGKLEGKAQLSESPFGKAVGIKADTDFVTVPRTDALNVADGDFTVAAWIKPQGLRRASIIARGGSTEEKAGKQGWVLELPDNRGILRLDAIGSDGKSAGTISSQRGAIKAGEWQHVAAIVHRGQQLSKIYVNGYPVGKGEISAANLDNPKLDLQIGRLAEGLHYRGDIDQVRVYRRALGEAELQALVQPGKQFVKAPDAERPMELTLNLGDREFIGTLQQPAFLAVRLPAGPLAISAKYAGMSEVDKIVFTPLAVENDLAKKFLAFEKRTPKLGVHLGFRRDCGSTFAPVGAPQAVAGTNLAKYVFEGAIRNYPATEVEHDNVNYLAGVREIAVRSEYTDGRDMPRMLVRSVEFEGPFYDQWPPVSHKNIFIDSARKSDEKAYAQEILRSFATRAYRRPASAAEVTALVDIYTKSAASGRNFQDSIKDTLQVLLTSPQFLFLVEKSNTPDPEPLESYELASKLSYFLWNAPPDRTTLGLAAAGTLRSHLDSEVERMAKDAKFSQFTKEFASQWLNLEKFAVLEPDKKRYPTLTAHTRTQLKQEPIQFVDYLLRNNLPVKNLIKSDFIVANESVAGYYGMPEKTDSGFQFVAIEHGRPELGGVLTQAAIMAGLSDGRESNPVKRGAWLARKIISEPPADPPPNVPTLKENPNLTLRQRIEQHRNQPGCQQCHAKIDPWGVAFEEFDAGGRLKQQSVDSRSTLPDKTEVSGANDLKRYLAEDRIDQVAFSFLKHLATYACGRTLSYSELDFLKRDQLKLKADGYRMKDMVHYVVSSKMFLEK